MDNLEKIFLTKDIFKLIKLYKKGDISARDKLINGNLYLVIWRVNTYFNNSNYDKEELINNGINGLIKAIDKFKPYGKVDFYSFVINRIDNEIYAYLRKQKKNNIKIKELKKDLYEK